MSSKNENRNEEQLNEEMKHEEGKNNETAENENVNNESNDTAEPEQESVENKELTEALEKIEQLEKEKKELNEDLLRKAAEFQNFKRRTERELLESTELGTIVFAKKILPVYDDLNRSVAHIDDEKSMESVKEGLKLVLNKFSKVFEEQGITKIPAKGSEFDVNLHDALMEQPTNEHPAHTVLEEIEPGYMFGDKVLRHAKVIVSKETE